MSVVDASIADAKRWADYLLNKEGGVGDNITWAAYQAESKWGAPASIIMRLRNREVTDMLLSNWVRLKCAYEAACAQAERNADHEEHLARAAGINEDNSRLAKAAALVGSSKGGSER